MTKAEPAEFLVRGRGTAGLRIGTRMEILCACDERYLPHTATMLCSLLENNRIYRIHLFYDTSVIPYLLTLRAFVEQYETELLCYEMVLENFHNLRVDRKVSIATYYRLAAPHILPSNVRKILYLDSDIIVRRSLEDLWNTDIQNNALAAVIDPWWSPGGGPHVELPPGAKYFNAGVLLINLYYWRKYNVSENAIAFARNNFEKIHYWDQDALNATLVDQWIPMPQIWNAYDFPKGRAVIDPAIVHFLGPRPWHWYAEHARESARYAFEHEYRRYRRKTPWPRYRLEGKPRFSKRLYFSLRSLARAALPRGVRRWLGARLPHPQV